jgi:hypothetical protein
MEEDLNDLNPKQGGEKELADKLLERAVRIVANVEQFKQPRLERIQLYRDLYAGKVKKKYRQPFNVVLPVFSGMIDTLSAEFNDDLTIELEPTEPTDFLKVKKLNPLWKQEVTSTEKHARFPQKTRTDRSNAIVSGRGFMKNYALSEPEYKNCFEIFELEDAIFQPKGGGLLENHLFAGQQNIIRSEAQLKKGYYNKTQVKELLAVAAKTDYDPGEDDTIKAALAKYKAMGLAPENSDYVGESLYKLTEMAIEADGQRWYIVFSPWYKKWVRFGKLSELSSADLYPWVSWATHEDNKNFLTKSYADDCYGIADAVHTLFNQELTNREKKNFNARAYDREIFTDVAKLDQAQTRPDALVPADTKGGTRKIADGIYSFETAQLSGTIDLINWMKDEAGRDVGVSDLSMGNVQEVSKKATVVFAEQQSISKRFLLRSSPYTEAMGEIVKRFIVGLKDHMPAKIAIRKQGPDGEGWDEAIREDLELKGDADIRIISSSLEMRNSQIKKESRMKMLAAIGIDPLLAPTVNPSWRAEEMLRSGGEYEDHEIAVAMDTKNTGNKNEAARAYKAIQEIQEDKAAEIYYGATGLFMEIIMTYANEHRNTLGEKYLTLLDYIEAHAEVAQENMARKAKEDVRQSMLANPNPEAPAEEKAPGLLPKLPPVADARV